MAFLRNNRSPMFQSPYGVHPRDRDGARHARLGQSNFRQAIVHHMSRNPRPGPLTQGYPRPGPVGGRRMIPYGGSSGLRRPLGALRRPPLEDDDDILYRRRYMPCRRRPHREHYCGNYLDYDSEDDLFSDDDDDDSWFYDE